MASASVVLARCCESLGPDIGTRASATNGRPCEFVFPKSIRVDNGPEFISKSLDWWADFHGVKLDFSRTGKPTDNAFIESFNGKFRMECLNQHWILSLSEAQAEIDSWREDYNGCRPHSALGARTPNEFAACSSGPRPG